MQPVNDNTEIPAVVAADTLIKLRRVNGYFSGLLIIIGFSWIKLRKLCEQFIIKLFVAVDYFIRIKINSPAEQFGLIFFIILVNYQEMKKTGQIIITVEAIINAPVERVWKYWTRPEDIIQWNNASEDWHTTRAENDLRIGGSFISRMEAKDGSFGFDFTGQYSEVKMNELIVYTIADGRKVHINFNTIGNSTSIIESFEAEEINSSELQKAGWQAILNNFKRYVESK